MNPPVVAVPLRVERVAVRGLGTPTVRTGMGPRRAAATAARLGDRPVLVAGVGGGLGPGVRPGDVVVATEVRGPGRVTPCPSAPLLAAALRRTGLTVHLGPVVSTPGVVGGAARAALAATGALAVDTESAWLAPPAGTPFAVVRSIVDTADAPLVRPGTAVRGVAALRALRRAVPALDAWAAALRPREVVVTASGAGADLLLDGPGGADLRALAGAARVGVTAGVPAHVNDLVRCLAGLGPVTVRDTRAVPETMRFPLPKEVS